MRKKKVRRKKHKPQAGKFLIAAALILCYLLLTVDKHGVEQGVLITALTWAFFVFLNPAPTAGLVFELPIRLLTRHRLLVAQYMVWGVGAAIVLPALLLSPDLFHTTTPLAIFYHVLTNPVPYWSLLLLCGLGTFLSVYLVDKVVDEVENELNHHHRKHMPVLYLIVLALALIGIVLAYNAMISELQLVGHFELY